MSWFYAGSPARVLHLHLWKLGNNAELPEVGAHEAANRHDHRHLSQQAPDRATGPGRNVGDDDYLIAIQDVRDGRTQLIHSARDLGVWRRSFKEGRCVMPAAAICTRCDRLHVDRDVDTELLEYCIGCCAELMVAGAEEMLR